MCAPLQSLGSRHTDICTCLAYSTVGQWISVGKIQWYRVRHPCHSKQCYANPSDVRPAAAVDCIWAKQEYEVDSCTWALSLYWTWERQRNYIVSRLHCLWCCSAFRGKGKKSAWQLWDMCAEASDVFARLSHYPPPSPTVNNNEVDILEKFAVIIYDKSSTATGVDNARLEKFALEAETIPSHSTNSISFTSACQTCCLPGRLHMEPINTASARNTEPCSQWMGEEWRSVKCSLDNASTYCRELSSTGDQVWLQVKMPREV